MTLIDQVISPQKPAIMGHRYGLQTPESLTPAARMLRESGGGAEGASVLAELNSKISAVVDKLVPAALLVRNDARLNAFGKKQELKAIHEKAAASLTEQIKHQILAGERLLKARVDGIPSAPPKPPKDAMERADQEEVRQYLRGLQPVEREAVLKTAARDGQTKIIQAMYHDPLAAIKPLVGDVTRKAILEDWNRSANPKPFADLEAALEITSAISFNVKTAQKLIGKTIGVDVLLEQAGPTPTAAGE